MSLAEAQPAQHADPVPAASALNLQPSETFLRMVGSICLCLTCCFSSLGKWFILGDAHKGLAQSEGTRKPPGSTCPE